MTLHTGILTARTDACLCVPLIHLEQRELVFPKGHVPLFCTVASPGSFAVVWNPVTGDTQVQQER